MALEFRLPFQRRRSRWEMLRESLANREEVQRWLHDARRLSDELPDATELARRAQPLLERLATARQDLHLPDSALWHDGLGRLGHSLGRPKQSTTERVLNAPMPLWVTVSVAVGALFIGFAMGQAAASSRGRMGQAGDLEAVSDKIKERWPAVHDDDIREAKGDLKRLSSVIGERTGESSRTVREHLAAMTAAHSSNGQS